jgi:hypothetical protein
MEHGGAAISQPHFGIDLRLVLPVHSNGRATDALAPLRLRRSQSKTESGMPMDATHGSMAVRIKRDEKQRVGTW